MKNRMNKGNVRNEKCKMVQQKHPIGIVPAAVIFSGACHGISNQGAMVMIQDTVERVKHSYVTTAQRFCTSKIKCRNVTTSYVSICICHFSRS